MEEENKNKKSYAGAKLEVIDLGSENCFFMASGGTVSDCQTGGSTDGTDNQG